MKYQSPIECLKSRLETLETILAQCKLGKRRGLAVIIAPLCVSRIIKTVEEKIKKQIAEFVEAIKILESKEEKCQTR